MIVSTEDAKQTKTDEAGSGAKMSHIAALDGVRGVAALFVVIHHAYTKLYEPTASYAPYLAFLQYGIVSVSVFIVLSGFCLALPVLANSGQLRGGYSRFLLRRARRILPGYYATLVLGTGIRYLETGSPFGIYNAHDGLLSLIRHALLIHNVWGNADNSIYGDHLTNGVMWSIAVEFQIYLWFPVFVTMARRFTPFGSLLITSAIAAVIQSLVIGTPWNGLNCPYYALFCAGMLAASLARNSASWTVAVKRAVALSPILSFAALVGFIAFVGLNWIERHLAFAQVIMGVFGFFIILAVASSSKWKLVFSLPHLVTLGGFSYSLYLIHMPLLSLWFAAVIVPLYSRFGSLISFALTLLLGIPVIVLTSRCFSRWFEFPFLNKHNS